MITEDQWNNIIAPKIMSLPGMNKEHDSNFIAEPAEEGVTTYVKFMSDHGVTDDNNGMVLSTFMKEAGCVVDQARPRSMILHDVDLIRLFL